MLTKHLRAFLAIVLGCSLAACHSDVDLETVDAAIEAHLKLAVPVASINLPATKLFGITDTTANISIDTIDGRAVLVWKGGDSPAPKKFSLFNLSDKMATDPITIKLYDHLKNAEYDTPYGKKKLMEYSSVLGNRIILPAGYEFDDSLFFDMPLTLDGINTLTSKERVDSAQLVHLDLTAVVNKINFNDLKWEWIDQIDLDLGESFELKGEPSRFTLYKKGDAGKTFGSPLEKALDNFTLNLMVNKKKKPSASNVYDELMLQTIVKYHIPSGTVAEINEDSGIRCTFNLDNMSMNALWGWFTPGPDMQDEGTYDFDGDWADMPIFKNAVLPFSRPKIEVTAETQVAGAIKMHGNYMRSWDKDGNQHEASFNGQQSFDTIFDMSQCADPAGPMDAISRIELTFDNSEEHGHIDKLFEGGIPNKISYQFLFSFDPETTPQIRIPKDPYVKLSSDISMPLTFKQGARITHQAFVQDIDISQFNIDSLLRFCTVDKNSEIGVIMKTSTDVPLHIRLQLRCIGEDGKPLKDPADPSKEFGIFDSDTLDIYPPQFTKNPDGTWNRTPREVVNAAHLSKEEMDLFPKTKSVQYMMWVDDTALEEAYKDGMFDIQISPDDILKLKIGITADLNAAIQLNQNNK